MRLNFTTTTGTQAQVHPIQGITRAAEPRRPPIGKILAIIAVVLALIIIPIWWWRSTRVYTYGVVATGIEAFHAPMRSKVLSVHVEPGDRVKADQVLYLLTSEDAAAEMQEARERLGQEQRVLEVALSQEGTLFEDPIQELRDLSAARARLHALEAEVPTVELQHQAAALARTRAVATARQLAEHRAAEAAAYADRRRAIEALRAVDAASADEVRRIETLSREAEFAAANANDEAVRLAEASRLADDLAVGEAGSRTVSLTQARDYLAEMQSTYHDAKNLRAKEKVRGIENIRSRIASLESHIAHLRTLAGPTEVRSLADGVVTEVLVREGSNVPKDGMILAVAGTGKIWINAFVPPDRAREVAIGDSVSVYPTTGSGRLTGTVTAGGGIQYKVHSSLQGHLSDSSAVYVRIDLDEAQPNLIPGNVARVVIR